MVGTQGADLEVDAEAGAAARGRRRAPGRTACCGSTPDDEQLLIEQLAGAWRPDTGDELAYHKAWHDLSPAARQVAYERARALRTAEAALDPDGLSTTSRAILRRIGDTRR